MVKALAQLKKQLLTIPVKEILRESLTENKPVIEDLNAAQLQAGIRADNSPITPTYRNPLYAQYKNRRNPKPGFGRPDLKNTGAFYEGIDARVTSEGLEIESTEGKTKELQAKYGPEIIGLTDQSITELQQGYLKPALYEEVRKYILNWRY